MRSGIMFRHDYSNSLDLSQQPWWQRSKRKRWFFYALSVNAEMISAGSNLYGFGGGTTVFGLGVLGSAALTVTIITSAAGVLAAIGMTYQAYLMKKNEENLYKELQDAITKQNEHLEKELELYHILKKEYDDILKEVRNAPPNKVQNRNLASKLNKIIANLTSMEDRLSIYEGTRTFESEIRYVQHQSVDTVIKRKEEISTLKQAAFKCYGTLSSKELRYSPHPPKLKPEASGINVLNLVYKGSFAFILGTGLAMCTGYLFLTPAGWATLALVTMFALLYLYADVANTRLTNKIAHATKFNTAIDSQIDTVSAKIEEKKNELEEDNGKTTVLRSQSDIMRCMKFSPSSTSTDSPLASPTLSRLTSRNSGNSSPLDQNFDTKTSPPHSPKFFDQVKPLTRSKSLPALSLKIS